MKFERFGLGGGFSDSSPLNGFRLPYLSFVLEVGR